MLNIDDYFKKGKSRKIKIWKKLKDYRGNKDNLIGRVITELCTVYMVSNTSFRGSLFFYLVGFVKDIGDLRRTRAR